MSRKIYIDWETMSYYTSMEEVRQAFEEDDCNCPDFNEYLDDTYSSIAIFEFTESDREMVRNDFEKVVLEAMEAWIEERFTIIDIDITFKESQNDIQRED